MAETGPAFACQQCGACCQGAGGILVTPAEVQSLAAYLGLSPQEFAARYLVDSAMGPQVATANGACVFLADRLCRVHPVKPRICREWPYLPALLAHADEFEAAKEACPGLAAQGRHQDFLRQARLRGCGAEAGGAEAAADGPLASTSGAPPGGAAAP